MEMAEKGGAKARLSLFIINVILRDRGMLIAYRLRLPVGWNINTIDANCRRYLNIIANTSCGGQRLVPFIALV
jgi:hypothetical protein